MAIKVIKRSGNHPNSYTVYAIFSANRAAELQVNLGLKTGQQAGVTTVISCKGPLNRREMEMLTKATRIATDLLTGEISVIPAADWEFKPRTF